MGCGSSNAATVVRTQSPTSSQRAQEIEITLRLDGENVSDVKTDQVRSLLADRLGERENRFTVSGEQDIPNVMHCIIHPRENLETSLRHMAERQAIQMIARQIKNRATEGQLALDRAMITEVALPGEQLQNEDGLRSSLMLRETVREVWQQADTNKNGSLDAQEFRNLMLSEKIGLGLQEAEVDQLLLKVDKNGDGRVVFSEFLPLCKEVLCAIYSRLNVETAGDWCQLWSIKTGYYYFNKRTGKYQLDQPPGYIPLPDREVIQVAPSEDTIPEVAEEAEREAADTGNSPAEEQHQAGPSGTNQHSPATAAGETAAEKEGTRQDGDTGHKASSAPALQTDSENANQQAHQRATDSGIDDSSM